MAACCRRVTSPAAAAAAAAVHHIPLRTSSSTNCLQVNQYRKFWQRRGAVEVVLRSKRLVIVAAAAAGGQDEDEAKKGKQPPRCCSFDRDAVTVAKGNSEEGVDRRSEVVVAAVATVVLGVGNRVLYKLALVPLKHYPFFLAQLATFGYVIVYFSILYIRYQAGKVTDEMLSLPKSPLIAIGLLEALAAAAGMASAAVLPGAAIPILSQSFLVWQLGLSYIFLKRKYRFNQLFGCFLVAAGVLVTVASGSGTGSMITTGLFWSILMIISFFLQAADTVLKETIFLDAAQRLKGGSMDLFVVNSFGSAYQAVFICLLLPFLSNLWGVPFGQLPSYLKDGAACFLNIGTMTNRCDGAPLLPVLFVIVNMGFNISLLHLLKISSAVVSCLASTLSVPISVYLFTLPLPYLGVASSLPPGFVAGAIILVVGMLVYLWTPAPNSPSSPTLAG
ncbi:CRT transporter 3 [Perilla frutescens var. frutescens]|nr:CRT transporter 3 [Perilla frutescens var. frutescens]